MEQNIIVGGEDADGDDGEDVTVSMYDAAVKEKKPREPFLSRIDCFKKVKPETRAKLLKFTTGMPFRVFFMVCVLCNVITLSITDNDMSTESAERAGNPPNAANIELKAALESIEVLFAF